MRGPNRECVFKVLDLVLDFLGVNNLLSESQGVAGCAEADGLVRIIHGLGKDCNALEHEAMGFLAGKFSGLLVDAGQFVTKVRVFEPAVQGPPGDFGPASGLGDGRRLGYDAQCEPLAASQMGISDFCAILCHSVTFSFGYGGTFVYRCVNFGCFSPILPSFGVDFVSLDSLLPQWLV